MNFYILQMPRLVVDVLKAKASNSVRLLLLTHLFLAEQ